jgi:hypothetical protein
MSPVLSKGRTGETTFSEILVNLIGTRFLDKKDIYPKDGTWNLAI